MEARSGMQSSEREEIGMGDHTEPDKPHLPHLLPAARSALLHSCYCRVMVDLVYRQISLVLSLSQMSYVTC